MKNIDLGQALSILANLGVIAGIVFLGIELRQNQLVGQSQVRNEVTSAYLSVYQSDMNLSDHLHKLIAQDPDESMTNTDAVRLNIWANEWFRLWENMHYQYSQGLFSEDEFLAGAAGLRDRINNTPLLRERFCRGLIEGFYSARFLAFVESLLQDPCD